MMKLVEGHSIDASLWAALVNESRVATWFQTQEAFAFFESLSFFEAFACAVESDGKMKGVVVGYIQKDVFSPLLFFLPLSGYCFEIGKF